MRLTLDKTKGTATAVHSIWALTNQWAALVLIAGFRDGRPFRPCSLGNNGVPGASGWPRHKEGVPLYRCLIFVRRYLDDLMPPQPAARAIDCLSRVLFNVQQTQRQPPTPTGLASPFCLLAVVHSPTPDCHGEAPNERAVLALLRIPNTLGNPRKKDGGGGALSAPKLK